ncbi:hypothetical protein PILCRDRAFT_89258 [Piloderma croceum F 1598]|uniref:Uncharacterized protein n=1 Tax=Piloderma croceum (strain F 1598) TaxID=765440 RepID=A0A0C3BVC6_PILCF|nr:hypothetical protein PILCRDRAFT_89258 [Piloderma croceum F 1598]
MQLGCKKDPIPDYFEVSSTKTWTMLLSAQEDEVLAEALWNANSPAELQDLDVADIQEQEMGEFSRNVDQDWFSYHNKTMFLLNTIDNLPRLRISNSMMQDFSNPLVQPHLHFYPEILDSPITEIWHAEKWWKDIDPTNFAPMYNDWHGRHYYINVSSLFIGSSGVVSQACVHDDENTLISALDLEYNFLDLQNKNMIPEWHADTIKSGYPANMPNSDRAIANGNPFYLILVDFFGDDICGNRTKSWNKHWNISTRNNPVVVFDVTANEEVCFKLATNTGPSDNPMQSEITGHIGGKGNHFCHKSKVGGNKLHKESDDGYHSLFEPDILRTAAGTLAELKMQANLSCLGVAKMVSDSQTGTGVKDAYTQFWINQLIERVWETKHRVPFCSIDSIAEELWQWVTTNEDKIYNPFLSHSGFDLSKDTPIEILHTILLGVVKYLWHTQLKTIVQTNVFHIYDLTDEHHFLLTKAVGVLTALLWYPEINNLSEYLVDAFPIVFNLLAGQESLKHWVTDEQRCSAPASRDWVQARVMVQDFLQMQPMLQGLLEWHDPKPLVKGSVKLVMMKLIVKKCVCES